MPAAFLPDRSLVRISGAEAQHFLHNLITTDMVALPAGEAWPGALLTPQGKILFDFLIWRDGDAFLLDTAATQRADLIKRLSMYKLRAAVTIAADGEDGATVSWGAHMDLEGLADARFAAAGIDVRRRPGRHGEHPAAGYDALRIAGGIAESGRDFALQDAFPHDVMLDLTHGLSFRKGCYVGQEVVSRMQHRGTARRRVVMVSAEKSLPVESTPLMAGGKVIGALGTVAGTRGLAIVRTDRAAEAMAAELPITAEDLRVSLSLAGWTGLTFTPSPGEA